MKTKVKSKIYKNVIDDIDNMALLMLKRTADFLESDVRQSQTMPKDIGTLQDVSTFVDDSNLSKGEVRVVTDTPYARKLYFHPEYNFRKDKNPNAGGLWFDPYISGNKKDFVTNTFNKLMSAEMKKHNTSNTKH